MRFGPPIWYSIGRSPISTADELISSHVPIVAWNVLGVKR
jgi:hypothetical protein